MRGQLEVLANQAETADKRQKDLYLDIDTRLRKLEQAREQQAAAAAAAAAAGAEAGGLAPARDARLPGRARPVQARQLPARGLGDAGLPRHLPEQHARAERAVLDRHGALRPARLQERDRRAAQAPRRVARQREGARRDAQHRQRAGNHGRPQERAEDARRAVVQVSEEQRRREREAAPRRVLQGVERALTAGSSSSPLRDRRRLRCSPSSSARSATRRTSAPWARSPTG